MSPWASWRGRPCAGTSGGRGRGASWSCNWDLVVYQSGVVDLGHPSAAGLSRHQDVLFVYLWLPWSAMWTCTRMVVLQATGMCGE